MFAYFDFLRELTVASVFFRFFLAAACAAVIGFERSKRRQAAGLRTHILVCIGAASVMLLNQYLSVYFNSNSDPARLGAQVVSGIGFLGAGTIVITGHQRGRQVKGLTTAAGLWASACMGLVIGGGFYEAAVIMCAFLFTVVVILNRIDEKYLKSYTMKRLYIEYTAGTAFSAILSELRKEDWHLTYLEHLGGSGGLINSVTMDVQRTGVESPEEGLLTILRSVDGVLFVEDV